VVEKEQRMNLDEAIPYPPLTAPYAVAQQLYRDHLSKEGLSHLTAWRGGWMAWQQSRWVEIDTAALRHSVYAALSRAKFDAMPAKMRRMLEAAGLPVIPDWQPWNPTKYKIANVLEALAAVVHLSSDVDAPAWIGHLRNPNQAAIGAAGDAVDLTQTPAGQVISCGNGLLDLSTRQLHDHTASFFNLVSVPLDYDADAADAVEWTKFLASVWGDDKESIALLQEWFGYVLSARMDLQKMLMLHGPIRSGKGTIERILAALMGGSRNIASPTLASLSTNFGLSPLIGKPLAFITDARLGNLPSHIVVERLLSITGEDWLTIDRKYRKLWTGKLPTRLMLLTNELPKFRDASSAIASRFLILTMTESFLGREDHTLFEKLLPELDSILLWALKGLDRLTEAGHFTEPQSSRDAVALMADLTSPVATSVRERLDRDPELWITHTEAFGAWSMWCEASGHRPGAKETFGRDLRAAVPEVRSVQRRILGQQVWTYTNIGSKPVTPVTGRETAGQDGERVSQDGQGTFDVTSVTGSNPDVSRPF
jgi:putative DNA primase/helicase